MEQPGYALVVGESLVDIVERADGGREELPGGSAANVAVALARLERPVRFLTAWGPDEHGRALTRRLRADGVRTASEPVVLDRTATALARIAADGSAAYEFDLDWRLGALPDLDDDPPRVVHTSSIAAVLAPGADDVLALLDHLADLDQPPLVSYDINARPAITGTGPDVVARTELVASRAQVVKASDEDLAVLYPHLAVEDAAARLRGLGPSAVVVTRGAKGAVALLGRGYRLEVAAPTVEVVDTIGAGDTFSAGLIDAMWPMWELPQARAAGLALLHQDALAAVLDHAARAAAITVSRPGADPPRRADLPI